MYENWQTIREQIEEGTYTPSPVRRIEIPKPNRGVRLLGIPTVTDRFIQQAVSQILTPIFAPMFSTKNPRQFVLGKSRAQKFE